MTRRPQIDAISGIRLFAILQLVVMHFIAHHNAVFKNKGFYTELPEAMQRMAMAGPTATGLFFILSGFILTYVYFDSRTRGLKISSQKFFITRASRIYPLHVSLLVFLGFWLADQGDWRHWIINAGLLQSLVPTTVNSWNIPAWAASAMILFYLLFPRLLLGLGRMNLRYLLITLASLFLVNLSACTLFLKFFNQYGQEWRELIVLWFYYSPAVWFCYFLTGIISALILIDHREKLPKFWQSHAFANVVLAVYVLALLNVRQLPHVFMRHSVMLPLQLVLIFTLVAQTGVLGWLCSRRGVLKLAAASFTIYLLHSPLMTVYMPLFEEGGKVSDLGVAGYFVILLVLSLGIERYFVEPVKALIVGLLEDHKKGEIVVESETEAQIPANPQWASTVPKL